MNGRGKEGEPAEGGVDSAEGIRYNPKEFKTGVYRQRYEVPWKREAAADSRGFCTVIQKEVGFNYEVSDQTCTRPVRWGRDPAGHQF